MNTLFRMFRKFSWIITLSLILLIGLPLTLFAQTNAGYAGSFLRMGLGARAIGLANTAPTGSDDAYGFFYNPASLPSIQQKQFGISYGFLPLDRIYNYAGFAMPLPPTAGIGIGWLATGVNDIQGRNSSGQKTKMYSARQNSFMLSFANAFSQYVRAGVLLKLVRNDLDEIQSSTVGFDLGVVIEPIPFVEIGLTAQNLNAKMSWDASDVYSQGNTVVNKFPVIYRIGGLFHATATVDLLAEYQRSDKGAVVYRYAASWNPLELASLRIGLADGYLSLGGGLEYDFLAGMDTTLDYAFVPGRVGEGASHYFSWAFQF